MLKGDVNLPASQPTFEIAGKMLCLCKQELDQRYNALLQMYGEKVEEAEELRLDILDVKDMYKSQVVTLSVQVTGR